MSNETPLHMHTPDTMASLIQALAPSMATKIDDATVTARLDGEPVYIRAKAEVHYGPGRAWNFTLMGPSEWGVDDPDQVVKQFCIDRLDQVRQVVDALAALAWERHTEATT